MSFTQKLHKFFDIKNLKLPEMFFDFKKIKFIQKIVYSLPLATIFLWYPQIVNAEVANTNWLGFLNPINWIKKLIEWIVGLGLAILAAFITFFAMIINLIVTALTWLASFFAEFAINLTLTTDYTGGDIFNAGWSVFRDIANMGLVLVLVAIALGTMLKLRIGNKDQLVPFIFIAFLINYTPVIIGIIIDIANILSFIFWDSAKNFVSAFMRVNPLNNVLGTLGTVINNMIKAVFSNFKLDDFVALMLTYSLATLLNLIILFIFLLLTALFFGRTLALLILGMVSPIAFLAYILPSTRKHFTTWWNNFLKWAMITIPLLISMWLGGIFINNLTGLCTETAGQYFTTNIPQGGGIGNALSGGDQNSQYSLLGDNGQNACAITSLAFAAAVLLMGVNISLKSSAAGAQIITSRAKKLRAAATKWAKSESAKRTQQVTAKPLATAGQKLAGTRLAQSRLGAPVRNLGLAMQTPAVKWKEQYRAESKRFANMTFEQMRAMLFDRSNKGAAAWAYAAKNDPDKLQKAVDEDKSGQLKKILEFMVKRSDFRGDDSMKDVEKQMPLEVAMARARAEMIAKQRKEYLADTSKPAVTLPTDAEVLASPELDKHLEKLDTLISKFSDGDVGSMSAKSLADEKIIDALEKHGKLTKGAIESLAKSEEKMTTVDRGIEEKHKREMIDVLKKMSSEERLKTFGSTAKRIGTMSPEKYRDFLLSPEAYKLMAPYKRRLESASPYFKVMESHPYLAARHASAGVSREDVITKKDLEKLREDLASSGGK